MAQALSIQANAYAAAKPLPALTGNKAQDVANIAISQLGYAEASDGGTVYGAWWSGVTGSNLTRAGWCAMFACWCANQAGAGMDVAYNRSGAQPSKLMSWLLENASGDTSFSVAPAPGDFIFFSTGSTAQHVAIVVDYNSATNKVTFVGGNQSNKVTQFTMLYNSSAKYGSQRIIGIGRPKYGSGSGVITPTCSCDESFAGTYQCITVTDSLNMRAGHGTQYSVVGSIPPGATVTITKAQGIGDEDWAHVEYNGVKGYCSMKYLKRVVEYSMNVIYNDQTGDITGATVEIYDYVSGNEMDLTLPEQLMPNGEGLSPVIEVTAKDGFLLHLEIPLAGEFSSVIPCLLDGGVAMPMDDFVLTAAGIQVDIIGSGSIQLFYQVVEHTHSYTSQVTTQPGCEAEGVRTYTCGCGETYTGAVAALGHAYTQKVTAPTCTGQGYTTHTCSRCGKSYQDTYTQATGHSYESTVASEPGCETKGVMLYFCACGEEYTEEISALGHSYVASVVEPDCDRQGYTSYVCSRCSKSYQDSYTQPTGHSYESAVTTAPTCEEKGEVTYTCGCGHSYTEEVDALGHNYVAEVIAPTCTAKGYTNYSCANCGDCYDADYVNATGHSFAQGKCSACGEKEPGYVEESGLLKNEDGNYYYYVNGEVATDYTGLVENAVGSWYVKEGMAQMSYDGLITFEGTKYLIKAGHVSSYTGIAKQQGVYYYFAKGVNDLQFEGLVLCNGMKAYVCDGEVNFNKTAVVDDNGTLCFVKYGIWRNTFKGLVRSENAEWLYMENGVFIPDYTGVAKLNNSWVYVSEGYVNFKFSGVCNVGGVNYTVKYGVVQF